MLSRLNWQEHSTRRDWTLVILGALLWVLLYSNLQLASDWVTYSLLGLDPASHFGSALNFFLYD
ncbi:MAG: permease, partial [Anaerolineae bacterium]|nr:permease [Anaerolineae bacterium]